MDADLVVELREALKEGLPWDAADALIPAATLRDVLSSATSVAPEGLTLVRGHVIGDLDLSRLQIGFPLTFEGTTFHGRVVLENLRAEDIWFAGGVINADGHPGAAVDGSGLQCRSLAFGSLTIRHAPTTIVAPGINLWGAEIRGDLHFEAVDLTLIDATTVRWALWLREARVNGDVGITVCQMPGAVELDGATIERRLYFDGTSSAPALRAQHVSLDRATVGELTVNLVDIGSATLSAHGAHIRVLDVWDPLRGSPGAEGTWPSLDSASVAIDRVSVPEDQLANLITWLTDPPPRGITYHRQPALAVATSLAAEGLQGPATRLRIEAEDRFRRQRIERWESTVPALTTPGRAWKQLWRTTTKLTAGHGHATGRAVAGVVVCLVGAYVATLIGKATGDFTYIGSAATQPSLFPELFAVDVVLGPMDLGQTDSWIATSRLLTLTLSAFKAGALFFAAMAVGSLSGLFRRV